MTPTTLKRAAAILATLSGAARRCNVSRPMISRAIEMQMIHAYEIDGAPYVDIREVQKMAAQLRPYGDRRKNNPDSV